MKTIDDPLRLINDPNLVLQILHDRHDLASSGAFEIKTWIEHSKSLGVMTYVGELLGQKLKMNDILQVVEALSVHNVADLTSVGCSGGFIPFSC